MIKKSNRIIRVANIIEEGRLGGPQMRMALVASELNKQKFRDKIDITFIFPKRDSKEFRERCDIIGVKYFLFSFSQISRSWFHILKYLIMFPIEIYLLSKFLKKNSFDIVHVSGGSLQSKGVIAAKIAKIKVLWELNDTYTPSLIRKIYFVLSRLANCFVFASNRTKEYYKKITPTNKKSFLIQSPVDINFYNPSQDFPIEAFINRMIKKKKIIIGTVANVSPVKDLSFLIKVAQKLSSYSNKIIFIVVGSVHNSQRSYYEKLLNILDENKIKNFFFLGPRTDVRPMLKAMDIYVCSSNNESSPLSLWEAMSMKKAVISTDVGDVRNFITEGINGFIVQSHQHDTVTEYIKKLINNSSLRNEVGVCAREIVKKKFDLKLCAENHFAMYKEIIKSY